jgi:hypothetical protein
MALKLDPAAQNHLELGCVCQAVRAPGVKWTLTARTRDGSEGTATPSM